MTNNKNTALHSYAYLILKDKGAKFSDLADVSGCARNTVKDILLGQKKSKRVQLAIARELGFNSWEEFEKSANSFYEDFRKRLEANVCG